MTNIKNWFEKPLMIALIIWAGLLLIGNIISFILPSLGSLSIINFLIIWIIARHAGKRYFEKYKESMPKNERFKTAKIFIIFHVVYAVIMLAVLDELKPMIDTISQGDLLISALMLAFLLVIMGLYALAVYLSLKFKEENSLFRGEEQK